MADADTRPAAPPPAEALVTDLFIARQPIFDVEGARVGYELLYRRPDAGAPNGDVSDERMTSEVISNAFLHVGIRRLSEDSVAFINFSRQPLVERVHTTLHPRTLTVELLERIEPDAEVVEACREAVAAGYTLALDDFTYSPAWNPLLELAPIVKIDVLGRTPAEIAAAVEQLRPWKVKLLAERVETREVFETCRRAGFALFQGYYFARPELMRRRKLEAAPAAIIRMLAQLRDENTTAADLERTLAGDVGLTVKLLRVVNSVAVGGRGISSLRHAIQLLGRAELARWLSLMLVTSVDGQSGLDTEVVKVLLRRARMCEYIAGASSGRASADGSFMVGLFSLLDAVLKLPMPDVLDTINLATELRMAIENREGAMGHLLTLVESYERGDWDTVIGDAESLGVEPRDVSAAYLEGMDWATRHLKELRGEH